MKLLDTPETVAVREKRTELASSPDRYFAAVCNNATAGMFIMDEHQYCVYMNPAAEQLTGFTLEELRGRPLHDCIHHTRPDGRHYPIEECPIDRVFPASNQEQGEEVFIHKDGTFYPVAYTASPIRENGRVVGTIIEVRDLRPEKERERKERESELRYRSLVSALPAAVYTCDTEGRITMFNEAAVALWGREPEIGRDLWCGSWKIFAQDGSPLPLNQCPMAVAIREGRPVHGQEIIVERPDGTRSHIAPYPEPLFDSSGRLIGAVNMLVDVTGLRRTEERLRQAEQQMRMIMTMMPAAVYTCDDKGRIEFFNRHAAELWGREPATGTEEQKFCGAFRLWKTDGTPLPHDRTPMASAVFEGRSVRGEEVVIERPDGTRATVSVNIEPLRDSAGNRRGAVNVFQDVTERRRSELALRQSEQRLRAVINNTPECVKIVARDGTLLSMNPAGLRMVEADSAGQVIGKNIYTVVAPEFREAFAAMNERVCSGSRENLLFQINGLKGTRRWMETCAVPFADPDTGELHQLAVTRDVTAQKEAEDQLREHRERLRAALDASNTGTFRWNIKTNALDWDEPLDRLFGLPPGKTARSLSQFISLVHPADRQRVAALCEKTAREGCDFDTEFRVIWPDSSIHWLSDKGKAFRDDAGQVEYMTGACVDITHRKHAEAYLHEQRDVLQAIVEGASLREVLERLTDGVELRSERKCAASILLLEADRLHPGAGRNVPPAWSAAIDGLQIGPNVGSCGTAAWLRDSVIVTDIENDPRWANYKQAALSHGFRACWSTPIISSESKVLGTFAIYYFEPVGPTRYERELVDVITRTAALAIERKRAEQALRESEARLAKTNEELDRKVHERTASLEEAVAQLEEFSYSVSHDLRAPLRAVAGYTRVILSDFAGNLQPAVLNYLERIARNTSRMEKLINDVLTLSRVGRSELSIRQIDLNPIVREIIEQNPSMQRPRAEIECAPLHPVLGDEVSIVQAVSNLLANAVKFVRPGTVPRVRIWTEKRAGDIRIWIEDNGIGIPPEYQKKLFGMFQRLTHNSNYEGTGIGLAIVRKAVERMRGAAGVESNGVDGSRFWLQLKAAE